MTVDNTWYQKLAQNEKPVQQQHIRNKGSGVINKSGNLWQKKAKKRKQELVEEKEEQDESKNRLRHKAEQIRIEPPHINHLPLRGNTTKVAKGAEHLQ